MNTNLPSLAPPKRHFLTGKVEKRPSLEAMRQQFNEEQKPLSELTTQSKRRVALEKAREALRKKREAQSGQTANSQAG